MKEKEENNMIQISCNNIKKYYGAQLILQGVSFEAQEGERIALYGPNGCGKSTMLKILCGLENVDEGQIAVRKGAVIGYLEQNPKYDESLLAKDVVDLAFHEIFKMKHELEKLEILMSGDDIKEQDVYRYSKLLEQYEYLGGYKLEERYSKIYEGLHIKQELLEKEFVKLSGGEKTLICLAKLLLMNPDILILDEPTNHLDMSMLEWLEQYLANYKGCVLFVSHDRYFLKHIATKVVDLEQGKSTIYPMGYDKYIKEKEQIQIQLEEAYKEQQKQIRKMEEAIKRMRMWAKQADNEDMFKRAVNMERRLERMDKIDKPISYNYQADINFMETNRSGKDVLEVRNLKKSYGTKQLLNGADLNVYYQEHVALIGKNGCGKTTFIKMLLGEETKEDGLIEMGASLNVGYLPQNVTFQNENATVLDTFRDGLQMSEHDARRLLAKYLFQKDSVHKQVKNLSGGERSRLRFSTLIQQKINFLILDEPTNHLDIPSRERFEEALLEFKGTILMISHDRYFINRLATRVVEFEDGKFISFAGGYDDYMEEKRKVFGKRSPKKKEIVKKKNEKMSTQPQKKSSYTISYQIQQIESEIEKLEKEKKEINCKIEMAQNNYVELIQLENKKKELEEILEEKMKEWERISLLERGTNEQ